MHRTAFSLAALAASALAAPALACSPAPGYRVPTNLELAADANAIILGEVVGGSAAPGRDPATAGIRVRPIDAIKGLMPGGEIRIGGTMVVDAAEVLHGNAFDFSRAHPSAYTGACIRRDFPLGETVLFFLDRENGEWRPAGGPFSRWAEDVLGRGAPWVQLAALYAEAALKAPEEREAFLARYREELLGREDDGIAQLMADDITRQLQGPNPPLHAEPPPTGLPVPEDATVSEDVLRQPATEPSPAPPSAEPGSEPRPATQPADDSLGDVQAAIDAMGGEER